MVKLLPECSKCGSPVTGSLDTEIEQHGKARQAVKNKNGKRIDDPIFAHVGECETIGLASESDVSPNTPRADGT